MRDIAIIIEFDLRIRQLYVLYRPRLYDPDVNTGADFTKSSEPKWSRQ